MKKIDITMYILIFLIVILIGYWGLGGFLKLPVLEQEMSGYTIVYIPFTGNMLKFHPNVDKVEKILEGKNIEGLGDLSIYHDIYTDKRSSASENDAGIIINPLDLNKLDQNSSEYKIMTIPAGKKMLIVFPYKIVYSCMVGHIRGNKLMRKYLKLHNNKYATIIELYIKKDNSLYYITEIQK